MLPSQILHKSIGYPFSVLLFFSAVFFSACLSVKKAPKDKAFVFATNMHLKSDQLSKDQKAIYEEQLASYVDDSLQVVSRRVIGFTQRLNPHVFDSAAIFRSLKFMNGFLNSEGYYNAHLDTFTVGYKKGISGLRFFGGRYKTTKTFIDFYVSLGKGLRVDSIWYTMPNAELQNLAIQNKDKAALKRNSQYNKQAVGNELERLATMFRNNGYFKMSRSALHALVDTTDPSLVSFDLDPVEIQLAALKRLEDPTVRIEIFNSKRADSSVFLKYLLDSVVIFPDANLAENLDSAIASNRFLTISHGDGVYIKQDLSLFKQNLVFSNNYLRPGHFYNEQDYFRTLNNYNQIGPWQQIDVKTHARVDSIGKLSVYLFLFPAKKLSVQFDLEGSQNTNLGSVLAGRFFSIGAGATARNRNFLRQGIGSIFSIRGSLELSNRTTTEYTTFQSFSLNANQSFNIPKLIWPFKFLDTKDLAYKRTNINLGGFYTNRFAFFTQTGLNSNLQWEMRKKNHSFSWALPVFETITLNATDSLDKILNSNPALRYSFSPGNVLSTRATWNKTLSYPNNPRQFGTLRTAAEVTFPGNFKLFNREFFKFIRLEGQFIHHIKYNLHSYDFRFFSGVGWALGKGQNLTMPFFRQFVAGGSNSMRGWGIRQLGLGNSLANDTASFNDRFGDIQLEVNAEYRRRLARFFGYYVEGAFFLDIGNIWNHHADASGSGHFDFKYLYRDIAVATGLGFRLDMNYLVIRLDGGYKLKDPVRGGSGWPQKFEFKSVNRLGTNPRNNFALQIGIGYPF